MDFILYRVKYIRDQEGLNQFGARLRQVRLQNGLTQEELAARSGIEFSQIGRIERGVINTSLSTVFVLAKTLQVDIRVLFDFTNNASRSSTDPKPL
ncbi:helix-turn-helix domain-containing protein [Nostoc sp. CHAB 5834]|nr:helix-turn-helix domain-containing protein [Nostoc sp. CHAB 5834]